MQQQSSASNETKLQIYVFPFYEDTWKSGSITLATLKYMTKPTLLLPNSFFSNNSFFSLLLLKKPQKPLTWRQQERL